MPGNLLIRDASLAILAPGRTLPNISILVENGFVSWIGRGTPPSRPPGTDVVDARGHVVSPGLVSAHTHLGLYPVRHMYRGFRLDEWVRSILAPWESGMEPRDSYSSAIAALSSLVPGGATLIADMHFNMGEVARAVGNVGIKASLSVAVMDRGPRRGGEALLGENLKLAEEWHGRASGRIRVSIGPCTIRLAEPGTIEKSFRAAREKGLRIQIHLSEVWDDVEYSVRNYRAKPLEFLDKLVGLSSDTIIAHGVWLSRGEIRLAAQRGVHIVHNPSTNMLLGSGLAPIWAMLSQGVNVALGVDVAPRYDPVQEATAAAAVAMLRGEPLTPVHIYTMLTVNGYRALGFAGGTIEKGSPGDLVLWRPAGYLAGDAFEALIYGGLEPVRVYVEGELVALEGELARIPGEEVEEHLVYLRERLAQIFDEEGYRF